MARNRAGGPHGGMGRRQCLMCRLFHVAPFMKEPLAPLALLVIESRPCQDRPQFNPSPPTCIMAPNQDDYSDREASPPKTSRHGHRSERDHPDDGSVDSGYGGSSAAASPLFPQKGLPRGRQTVVPPLHSPRPEGIYSRDAEKRGEGTGEDSEGDSDYDPKSKYYIKVDDSAYRDMSFRGDATGEDSGEGQDQPSRDRGERRGDEDAHGRPARRPRSDHDHRHGPPPRRDRSRSRSRAPSASPESTPRRRDGGRRRQAAGPRRCPEDGARPRRRDPRRSQPSPAPSDPPAEEERQTPPGRSQPPQRSRARSRPRAAAVAGAGAGAGGRRGAAAARAPEPEGTDSEREGQRRRDRRRPSAGERRSRRAGRPASPSPQCRQGAADMDDAWYRTFRERLTRGVDLGQVKRVGLDAAAVAAVKVAVGTQMPWRQRIPKTIAVGLAAAVTDFVVSKTSLKPKGMVGTMYARQLVEIALANLIINPVSNKVTGATNQESKGQVGGGSTSKSSGGGGARSSMGRRR